MNRLLFVLWLFNLSRNFVGAILVVYLVSKGISIHIIAIAKSAQLILSVIANVPAGKIAAKYGNKISIFISCLCAMMYFCLLLSPTDEKVILAEVFNGLSIAFYVGAAESWLLKFKSKSHSSYSLFSRKTEIVLVATIISSIISSLLINYSLSISLLLIVITLLFLFSVSEDDTTVSKLPDISDKKNETSVKYFLYKHRLTVFPLILMLGSVQLLYQFWPVYFQQDPIYVPDKLIGSAFGFSLFIQFLIQVFIRKNLYCKRNIHISFSVMCLGMILFIFIFTEANPSKNLFISVFFIVFYSIFSGLCSAITNLLFSQLSQSFDQDNKSSTIISSIDASGRFLGAIFLLIIYLFETQSIHIIWSFIPVTLCMTLVIYLIKNHTESRFEKKHGNYIETQ